MTPCVILIELRQALISYQDDHMCLCVTAVQVPWIPRTGGRVVRGALPGEQFYPQNHVGRGWGIRNGAMGAVRLPKILLVTIGAFVSAQEEVTLAHAFDAHRVLAA